MFREDTNQCESHPIGWVNLLGNRVNNLYPTNWRVRMGGMRKIFY
ncbi:MAG: methyltransferase RsmF C-terminal domain-like protein [Cyclobacteriaceae bacterium]